MLTSYTSVGATVNLTTGDNAIIFYTDNERDIPDIVQGNNLNNIESYNIKVSILIYPPNLFFGLNTSYLTVHCLARAGNGQPRSQSNDTYKKTTVFTSRFQTGSRVQVR